MSGFQLSLSIWVGLSISAVSPITPSRKEVASNKSPDSGPTGLKWVTIEQWKNMPGGINGNPAIIGMDDDSFDVGIFGQVFEDGCWQTGQVSDWSRFLSEFLWDKYLYWQKHRTWPHEFSRITELLREIMYGNEGDEKFRDDFEKFAKYLQGIYWTEEEFPQGKFLTPELHKKYKTAPTLSAANDGKFWTNVESKRIRILVNPGNSTKIIWRNGKKPFPEGAVFGDKTCQLRVGLTKDDDDSKRRASQVDEDGYVYYFSNDNWQWDNVETYDLLTESPITKYEILSIKFNKEKSSLFIK